MQLWWEVTERGKTKFKHLPTYTAVTFRKVRHKSNSAQVKLLFIYKHGQLKSKFQNNETWSTAAWSPSRLCYRPTIFFHHLLLVARITKILYCILYFFQNRLILKPPFLILTKSVCVLAEKPGPVPLDPTRIARNLIRDWCYIIYLVFVNCNWVDTRWQ
jgi:hypothetical protein